MTGKQKSILFAFSDTGGGHRSAAVALRAAIEQQTGGDVSCHMVDMLHATNFPLLRDSAELYNHLSTTWLPFYNLAYSATNNTWRIGMLSKLVYWWSQFDIVREILGVRPQVVVVPHPLVQRLVCYTRRNYRLSFRVVTVVTDLVSIHESWVFPEVDRCCVPTDEAYAFVTRNGMPPDKIHHTGFPVHPKFAQNTSSKTEARQSLAVDQSRTTILLTSGGVGSGHMEELVLALERAHPDTQLLVVTGKNQALAERLRSQPRNPHSHIYGFVQNMEELMAASDIVVTKAGPGTLMEALVMRRPVIVTEAVGLQEVGNIDFVVKHKLGFHCPTTPHILEAIETLNNPDHYARTIERLDVVQRNGATHIATLLKEQLDTFTVEEHKP